MRRFFFEFGGGFLPYLLRLASMNYLASQLAGFDKGGLFTDTVPDVTAWVASLVIVVLTLIFLGLAWLVVETSEFRFARA